MISNLRELNTTNLRLMVSVSKKTLDAVVSGDRTEAFSQPSNVAELDAFNQQVEAIIVDKIRNRLKV